MVKGRHLLSTDPDARQELHLKLGYSDEDSRETYLGLTDADFRATPYRRYRASRLDQMSWHRTQIVGAYRAELWRSLTIDVAVYRHDLDRTWRKVNRVGGAQIAAVLANPMAGRNPIYRGVLAGEMDTTGPDDTIYIGPNRRDFVSQGIQTTLGWRGATGPVTHRLELGGRVHYDRIDRLHEEDGFLMRGGALVAAGTPTVTTANARAWTHAVALHVADAATWGPLTLTPGVRVELVSTFARDRLAGRETQGADQRVVIPGAGAYVALTPALGLLAGAYRGFSPAGAGQPAAVDPETSVNYEAGARWHSGRLRLEAIGFFNDYRNLTSVCTFASGCTADRVDTQYDAGRARIWGGELFAQADVPLGGGFSLPLLGAYTLTRTELLETFTSEDPSLGRVDAGDELPYVPRHQASATIALEHARGGLAVGTTYVSPMRESAGQGESPPGEKTDASFLLDVTARVRVQKSGEVYVNVRNLLDEADLASRRPFGARPIAPRWVQVGTKWGF
jgi:Fe(3+) dicitrate transport protein